MYIYLARHSRNRFTIGATVRSPELSGGRPDGRPYKFVPNCEEVSR